MRGMTGMSRQNESEDAAKQTHPLMKQNCFETGAAEWALNSVGPL